MFCERRRVHQLTPQSYMRQGTTDFPRRHGVHTRCHFGTVVRVLGGIPFETDILLIVARFFQSCGAIHGTETLQFARKGRVTRACHLPLHGLPLVPSGVQIDANDGVNRVRQNVVVVLRLSPERSSPLAPAAGDGGDAEARRPSSG